MVGAILKENNIQPSTICELGCGTGDILLCLHKLYFLEGLFSGFYFSPDLEKVWHELIEENPDISNFSFKVVDFHQINKTKPDVLFGTRFIIFLLVLDIGLMGCFIFLKIALDLITCVSKKSRSPELFQHYSHCIISVSLFNDSYFFVCN